MSTADHYDNVLYGITAYLRSKLSQLSSECSEPGCNPDKSDNEIKQLKSDIVRLRVMREEFENVIAGLGASYSRELCTNESKDIVYKYKQSNNLPIK